MNSNIPQKPSNDKTDTMLRNLFHSGALQAPPSPWFTQNVLHRLPNRKKRIASLVEYALYIIGIIATVVYSVVYVSTVLHSSAVTVNNLMTFAVLMALLLSLCYMVIMPFARQSVSE